MSDHCPACLGAADRGRSGAYRDIVQVVCPVCGPFELSKTAEVMLGGRVGDSALDRARLSHAIRGLAPDQDGWRSIHSRNLDSLLSQPLPPIDQQVNNLLRWLADTLGDDFLGEISVSDFPELPAVVGAVDLDRVRRLIRHAVGEGLVEYDQLMDKIGLTQAGWQRIRH